MSISNKRVPAGIESQENSISSFFKASISPSLSKLSDYIIDGTKKALINKSNSNLAISEAVVPQTRLINQHSLT